MGSILSCAKGVGTDKGPSHVVQADSAALATRRKHVQIARDYIRCATAVVIGESGNHQD